jgi:hypothetical protein
MSTVLLLTQKCCNECLDFEDSMDYLRADTIKGTLGGKCLFLVLRDASFF